MCALPTGCTTDGSCQRCVCVSITTGLQWPFVLCSEGAGGGLFGRTRGVDAAMGHELI